ncbi:MAG: hypothetical protein IJX63_07500 [Lachnospiraceae bacterium]|nr:hypothetical protein [Lachnospiraceae bacterium]
MNKLDEIFRKHLERIREELNSYIDLHLPISENRISTPVRESTSVKKKKSGVQEKFLNYMKQNDSCEDEFEDDYPVEVDEGLSAPIESEAQETMRLEAPRLTAPCLPLSTTTGGSSGTPKMPEFLKKNVEHRELDKVLEKKEESFSEMLLHMIDEKGLKDSDVYKRANIDRRLFSKIRADEDYVPSRKTAISFCLALQLELEEAKKLLATAGYTLSASSKFDLIIMYLIENNEYNIHFANIVLNDYGEGTLSR